MESIKNRIEDLADSIVTISADPYGAKIFGKRIEDSIDVFMIEPNDDRTRLVGTIKEQDGDIVLYKKENEKDKHRNTHTCPADSQLIRRHTDNAYACRVLGV